MEHDKESALQKVNHGGAGFRYLLKRIFANIASRIVFLAKEAEEVAVSASNLKKDLETGASIRSGYVDHYVEQVELDVWKRYKVSYLTQSAKDSEVVFRATHVRNVVLDLIAKNPKVENIINIGCSYGWLENEIALNSTSIRVYGIDRSEEALALNRAEFPIGNLKFISGDFDSIIQRSPEILRNSVVCHVNFGVYFLPEFLMGIYRAAFDGGALNIVIFEPSGISRQWHQYYPYSMKKRDPWIFRGPMLLNNYPAILDESGF